MIKKLTRALLVLPIISQLLLGGLSVNFVRADDTSSEESVIEEAEEPYLIISAVQITGGTGKTQEDFVELYNPTNIPFNLKDHRLVKRTAVGTSDTLIVSWTENTVVPPHHFWLWANSSFTTIVTVPDSKTSGTLADNNGIALRSGANDTGEIIDSLAWGSTANGFDGIGLGNPPANESLVRKDLFDLDSGFEQKPSNPRNSSISEISPIPDPIPETEDQSGEEDVDSEAEPSEEESPEPEHEDVTKVDELKLEITELLPNPSGTDTSAEKIELYNSGNEKVNLKDFLLDDIAPADPHSTNAYIFPEMEIGPQEYLALTLPPGSFTMNNTGGEIVTLFDSDKNSLGTVSYLQTAPEGKSYTKFSDQWAWADPTFGKDNGELPVEASEEGEYLDEGEERVDLGDYDNSNLKITELYVSPVSGQKEFVEIYNSSETETAQLSVVSIQVGEKQKPLSNTELSPGDYYIVEQGSLPAQLRNSGQIVKIVAGSKVLDEVTYLNALDEGSYSKFEDGFLWTLSVTPGKENVLNLPEEVRKTEVVPKPSVAKKASEKAKTATKSTIKKSTVKPVVKSTNASATAKNLNDKQDNGSQEQSLEPNSSDKSKEPIAKVIAMGAAAAAAGVVALYKLVFSKGE